MKNALCRNAHGDDGLRAVYLHLEGNDDNRVLVTDGLHHPGIRFDTDELRLKLDVGRPRLV